MSFSRAFQAFNSADEPQVLFCIYMKTSELRKYICRIPPHFASNYFPAFEEGSESMKVVFLDERMNAWSITYTHKLVQNGFSKYTLREGWRQVIEDKELQPEDCVFFFGFKQSYIFIAIRRTPDRTLKVLEPKSGEPILLHPDQVRSAKLLASKVSLTEEPFAMEYIACIYGIFEAGGSQIQGGASSSTASPTLSLQDFETIYQMFQESAKNCVGPVEIEKVHLPSRIPRNFSGQDFDKTYSMIEERRIFRLNQVGSANSMDQQISHPTSTSSSGHLSQSNFQSRGIQTIAGVPILMAPTIQSSTNHAGYFSQTQAGAPGFPCLTYIFVYNLFPGRYFSGDVFQYPEVLRWIGAQIQASAPSFMASQRQYQTSRSLSGQSSRAQTQAGAPSSMASQIEQGTSTNSSGQDPLPTHEVAQEREALNQEALETSNGTHPQMFQSTGAQNRALQLAGARTLAQARAPSFPAYPASYNRNFRCHFGFVSPTRPPQITEVQLQASLPNFPHFSYEIVLVYNEDPIRTTYAFVPQRNQWQWTGVQIQASAPSFMASQNQYQTPRSFSEQSSGAQTQLGAPSLMASQIQHGTLSSSSGQDSTQERGAPNQEAAETRGTEIQGQQDPGNAHSQQENRASQSSHDLRNSSLELQSGGTEFKPFDTNISPTPQPKLSEADINPQPSNRFQLTEEEDHGGSGDPHGEGAAAGI